MGKKEVGHDRRCLGKVRATWKIGSGSRATTLKRSDMTVRVLIYGYESGCRCNCPTLFRIHAKVSRPRAQDSIGPVIPRYLNERSDD